MLAIIIPYYKLAFFDATLESLANQTDDRFTVFIGDDNSIESPLAVVGQYDHKINIKYSRFCENFGSSSLVKHWHRCLELAGDEEWIVFLGDDDVLQDNVVAAFYNQFDTFNKQVNVVRFSTCKIDALGHITSEQFIHPPLESATDFLFRNVRSSLSEYAFRKSTVQKIGFRDFPLAWFSDLLAVLEFSNFKNVYSINTAVVLIRISALSISGQQVNSKLKQQATFDFYYYLVSKRLNCFNSQQQLKLYNQINKSYYNDKKNMRYFLKLTYFYMSRFLVVRYFYFIKSLIAIVIKSKNESRI
jgi:glycosyltransferase involved in cell wall biosynthesis